MSKPINPELAPLGSKTMALPSDELFDVDEFLCMLLGKRLSGYRDNKPAGLPPEYDIGQYLTIRIAVASVCHQFNWDLLNKRLPQILRSIPPADLAGFLATISAPQFEKWFPDLPEIARLRAKERARILREVGQTLRDEFGGDSRAILERSNRTLLGSGGFYELMDKFPAFREDPLRKKTNVLTHDIVRLGIVSFRDMENIAPAIDYHLIRIYLRTGRVYAKHRSVFDALVNADPMPRDRMVKLLREKVALAVKLTAQFSRLSIPDVNYIEWQLGRRICVRETAKCVTDTRVSDLDPDILTLFERSCPFIENCRAVKESDLMQLKEPVFQKTFY